jgi:hypothetical protein
VGGKLKTRSLTRKRAIREFCVHCMQSPIEVRFCTSKTCALYPFRVGSEGSADEGGNNADV